MEPPSRPPVLESERLRLRPFTAADAADVSRLAGDRRVADMTAHIPHPYPASLAETWIATHEAEWTAGRQLILAVTRRDTGALVGAMGLTLQPEHAKAELGYWIGVPHWGAGYATEAARTVVDYAFNVLGLNRVQAQHLGSNPASGRVLAKAGLRREGVSPEAVRKAGRLQDVVFYGVLRRDWTGSAAAGT